MVTHFANDTSYPITQLTLVNCLFVNNTGGKGAAVRLEGDTKGQLVASRFESNAAEGNGSAVLVQADGELLGVSGCEFENNGMWVCALCGGSARCLCAVCVQ